jgi:hypothetical protein
MSRTLGTLMVGTLLAGCAGSPSAMTDHPDWGAGVRDPSYVRDKAALLLANEQLEHRHIEALAMMRAMTWQQACDVYRTATIESGVKELMVMALVEGHERRFIGRNKQQIVALLGRPDAIWNGDDDWYYTGTGHVSDSSIAFELHFGSAGCVAHVIYPN